MNRNIVNSWGAVKLRRPIVKLIGREDAADLPAPQVLAREIAGTPTKRTGAEGPGPAGGRAGAGG